jgi:hypothetical protein
VLLAFVCVAIGGVIALPARGQNTAPIPEPDITYFGNAPAGSQISITHPSGQLDSASATAANPYVLTVKLVQPVVTPTPALPPAGTGYVGDTATVLVNGVVQGKVKLEERGAVYRLDIANPAKTPSPNALLSPVRVVPSVPTPGPTGTPTLTPTGGTPTKTRTPTPTATKTPGISACVGDCDGIDNVTVDQLLRSVNDAVAAPGLNQCEATDPNRDNRITVDELVIAVDNALHGCPQVNP